MTKWTDWMPIDAAIVGNRKLAKHGIYQIRAITPRGKPIRINRLLGTDTEGILYVGRSGFKLRSPSRSISNRLREFLARRHSGGITYAKACSCLNGARRFVGHELEVRAMFVDDTQIAATEARVLAKYFETHAELPPCNSSAGARPKDVATQQIVGPERR